MSGLELLDRALQGLHGFSVTRDALAVEQPVQEFPVRLALPVQLLQHLACLGVSARIVKFDGLLRGCLGGFGGGGVLRRDGQDEQA